MGTRTLVRWLGITLLLDGVRSVIFGSGVAAWSFRQLAAPRSRGSVQPRLAVATRALGVAEALAGAWLVGGVSLRAAGLYRLIGHYYDYISLVWQKWLFRDAQATIESSLARWLPPNGRVLDLGCGTGANLDRIVSLRLPYGSYTGVDFSVTMLTEAARKFGNLSNVRFHQRDLASDPLPEGAFDLVVSTWALSHIPLRERVVEKAWDQLRPGGHMLLVDMSQPTMLFYPILRPLVEFVDVHPLPPDFVMRVPGKTSVQRLSGGWTTVVASHKPS